MEICFWVSLCAGICDHGVVMAFQSIWNFILGFLGPWVGNQCYKMCPGLGVSCILLTLWTVSVKTHLDVSSRSWRWTTDSMNPCMHDLVSRGISESMNHWFQWTNESTSQWTNESENPWINEPMNDGRMKGWMGEWMDGWAKYFCLVSCFFTERPLRWVTSFLSYSFSVQPLIRATSASQLALLQLLQPNSSLRAAVQFTRFRTVTLLYCSQTRTALAYCWHNDKTAPGHSSGTRKFSN